MLPQMWLTKHDDVLTYESDLHKLADWSHAHLNELLLRATPMPLPEQLTASDLLRKLLDPDVDTRLEHFTSAEGNGMRVVLKHAFFQGNTLDTATLTSMSKEVGEVQQAASVTRKLSEAHLAELRFARQALLTGLAENVKTPTAFVLLKTVCCHLASTCHDETLRGPRSVQMHTVVMPPPPTGALVFLALSGARKQGGAK